MKDSKKDTKPNGVREGIARSLSQALVYGLESKKTLQQIHGYKRIPKLPMKKMIEKWTIGISTSCITAGLVFYTYFSVYNRLLGSPTASSIAAFTTSFIKLPIGNSMRLMQSGEACNIFNAGQKLYKANKFTGLYSGYGVCLLEDMIEMDVKMRIYNGLKYHEPIVFKHKTKTNTTISSLMIGALSGAISSSITTPFDTIRAHMCVNRAKYINVDPIRTAMNLCKHNGPLSLLRGMPLRAASNAVKSAAFFVFFELLSF